MPVRGGNANSGMPIVLKQENVDGGARNRREVKVAGCRTNWTEIVKSTKGRRVIFNDKIVVLKKRSALRRIR